MGQRIERINSLLQKAISEIISKDIEIPEGVLMTITRTEVSPDLKQATAYINVIPDNNRGTVLDILKKNRGHIQKKLGKQVKTRATPLITFLIDEKEVYSNEIERILDELQQE